MNFFCLSSFLLFLKGSSLFSGETSFSIDISPILIGLGGTVTGLGLILTGVLMALWRKHAAATPSKPKPLQQSSIGAFAVKGEEEDGNPDLIPVTALTNNCTGTYLLIHNVFMFYFALPFSLYSFIRIWIYTNLSTYYIINFHIIQ